MLALLDRDAEVDWYLEFIAHTPIKSAQNSLKNPKILPHKRAQDSLTLPPPLCTYLLNYLGTYLLTVQLHLQIAPQSVLQNLTPGKGGEKKLKKGLELKNRFWHFAS